MNEPRFVEATGQDVESAIQSGLARLGVDSKDVIVEVLEESSRGLFGIGGKPAKVRLTLLAPPSPPAEAPARKPSPRPKGRTRKPRQRSSQAPAQVDEVEDDGPPAPEPKLTPPTADDEDAQVAVETLQELLAKMEIDAKVEANYVEAADDNEEGPLVLQVTGRDLGKLIGRRGETLQSLQYITRLIVSRELQRRANIVVDIEHYKTRREKRLHSLALRMAKQATQRNRTVTLEPMPAYERRIIHLTLRDRTDVYTQSIGEGDSRKVTIVPVRDR